MSERDAIASVLRLKAELEALQQQLDACKEKDERIAELKQENARLREAVCGHEWFLHYEHDNMEQCHGCWLWRDRQVDPVPLEEAGDE